MACLEAGAAATGCRAEARWHDVTYADMRTNRPLLKAYAANSERLGRPLADPGDAATPRVSGSTDMANVSHLVPSIHPMIAAGPPEAQLHTVDFARHARSSTGDRAVVDGAKLLALTAIDVWVDENLRQAVRADFEASGGRAASVPGI
jgi:metal-dependent amidase/aminoacylase/carboxypeptidase family protein